MLGKRVAALGAAGVSSFVGTVFQAAVCSPWSYWTVCGAHQSSTFAAGSESLVYSNSETTVTFLRLVCNLLRPSLYTA